MAIDSNIEPFERLILEFKNSTFTVPVLVLAVNDIVAIASQLELKIKQAPKFFENSPIIIDLHKIAEKEISLDLVAILELMRNASLQLIGFRGGNEAMNKQAQMLKIALLTNERKFASSIHKASTIKNISPTPEHKSNSKQQSISVPTEIISRQIRSGQKIYASGDLIILATVSAGAEVMAEGNIHIYGVLRGRALAGARGNEQSRIFCSNLQAELISIAGNYQVSENISPAKYKQSVQILLDNKKLIINQL